MTMEKYAPYLQWIEAQHQPMVDTLMRWSNINSGSLNLEGLERMYQQLEAELAPLEGTHQRITVKPWQVIDDKGQVHDQPLGDALSITKRENAKTRLFLGGHMDTVFSKEHPFQECIWLDKDTLNGPGVADLKGGLVIMSFALKTLESFLTDHPQYKDNIGWQVLLNPDEEIGSPGSAELFIDCAKNNHAGLIFEPCLPNGNYAGGRKGSGNFSVVFKGLSAHAGRDFHSGKNAVVALADFTQAINALNGQKEGLTVNPAFVNGGGPNNMVPDMAVLKFNIRYQTPGDDAWAMEQLNSLCAEIEKKHQCPVKLHGSFARKVKPMDEKNTRLYQHILDCGRALDLDLSWQDTGGVCDGNNLFAAGLANIDTLGIQGGELHNGNEYAKVASLVKRTQLCALFLLQVADRSLIINS